MKSLCLLLLCLCAVTSLGQGPAGDSPLGVKILKYKWQKAGPGPTVDPSLKAESDSPTGDSGGASDSVALIERAAFVYTVEIKNEGSKPIKAIRWDYIIVDNNTGEELGKHEFESFDGVGRNKTKALIARSRLSPTRVVKVQGSEKTENSIERVILKCVLYEDDSLWQQAGVMNQICEAMRQRARN